MKYPAADKMELLMQEEERLWDKDGHFSIIDLSQEDKNVISYPSRVKKIISQLHFYDILRL